MLDILGNYCKLATKLTSTTPRPTWLATSGSRLAKANGSWNNTLFKQLIRPVQLIVKVQPMTQLIQPTDQPANLTQLGQPMVNLAKVQHTDQPINLAQRQPMAQLTSQIPKVQPRLKTSKCLKVHERWLRPKSLKLPRDCHQAKIQPRNGSPSMNQAAHTPLKTANTMDATNFPVHT